MTIDTVDLIFDIEYERIWIHLQIISWQVLFKMYVLFELMTAKYLLWIVVIVHGK